ncbi:hypothetical protein [Streptomyces umbrinus]|uniref:hypothetical protein n=1 Tax=Streptomyces umbrinus TaxID=67370 RepID=UPI003C2D56B9
MIKPDGSVGAEDGGFYRWLSRIERPREKAYSVAMEETTALAPELPFPLSGRNRSRPQRLFLGNAGVVREPAGGDAVSPAAENREARWAVVPGFLFCRRELGGVLLAVADHAAAVRAVPDDDGVTHRGPPYSFLLA